MLRVLGAMAIMALTASLSGCAPPGQAKAPTYASLGQPLNDAYVQLSVIERKLIEVNASGRTVRASAPEGYCFPTSGIMTGEASAFLLLQPCNGDSGKDVLSLSIAKHGLFGDEEPTEANFAAFRSFLKSQEGVRQLGLDAGSGAVFLIETMFEDGVLYALAKDASGTELSFSGQIICRAFTELNGRMVVVSAIASKKGVREPALMREDLAKIVNRLVAENSNFGA
jgi:hypothetical protein